MSFLNWWGLLGLLAIPPLVLLYFLKLKRPRQDVSSTLLWQKVIEDMRVNSPFQRLRRSLLLLLQLLLLLALALALARPIWKGQEQLDASIIVLLDNSASMGARDKDGRTRFQHALEATSELIDKLSDKSELMVVTFNARAREVCSFSNSKRELREALDQVQLTDAGTDIRSALSIADSLSAARPDQNPRIVILSDGAFPDPGEIESAAALQFQQVGSSAPNVAVTGLEIRRSLQDRRLIEMFVAIRNFGEQPGSGTMSVTLDGKLLDSIYFEVEPGKGLSRIFEADLPFGGVVAVELDMDDDAVDALPIDNRAWHVVPPPASRRILLVGEGGYFLQKVFRAMPDTQINLLSAEEFGSLAAPEQYDMVVWHRVQDPPSAPGNHLYLGCAPDLEGLTLGKAIANPPVMDWDNGHPLTRFLDFSNLLIRETAAMTEPPGSKSVLRATNTPLVTVIEETDGAAIVVGFSPYQSNWPLLISFPLFLQNSLQYFETLAERNSRRNLLVGDSISVDGDTENPRLRRPDGQVEPIRRNSSGDYHYGQVDRVGIYRVQSGPLDEPDRERALAVNLFSPLESDLRLPEAPLSDQEAVEHVSAAAHRMHKEYFPQLLAAVLVLLALEWLVYHRRLFT